VLDAYALAGVRPAQVGYLSAPDHLGPTHLYGVTFERGAQVAYRDRTHLIVSGTASIDSEGRVLHPGDVLRQLDRALENIAALLRAGGATLDDLAVVIAYVRDPADLPAVRAALGRHCNAPAEVLIAPICRPAWLVEVEAIAICPAARPDLPAF
jgi:enamine deaminase RidA (YjgF/YER057c/UK114 family)